MTGHEIRSRVFPLRIRGYDPAQVDTWLAYVADVLDAGPSALDAGTPALALLPQRTFSVVARGYDRTRSTSSSPAWQAQQPRRAWLCCRLCPKASNGNSVQGGENTPRSAVRSGSGSPTCQGSVCAAQAARSSAATMRFC